MEKPKSVEEQRIFAQRQITALENLTNSEGWKLIKTYLEATEKAYEKKFNDVILIKSPESIALRAARLQISMLLNLPSFLMAQANMALGQRSKTEMMSELDPFSDPIIKS